MTVYHYHCEPCNKWWERDTEKHIYTYGAKEACDHEGDVEVVPVAGGFAHDPLDAPTTPHCPSCGCFMEPEFSSYKCPRCNFRDSCCEGGPRA